MYPIQNKVNKRQVMQIPLINRLSVTNFEKVTETN